MSKAAAAQAITIICSAYGQVKPEQEAFQRLAIVALEDFSDAVLLDLVNPKTGIISSSKFPPSIAEMVDWCRTRTYEMAPPVARVNPALLPAPDFSDDERGRVLAKFALLQQEMSANAGRDLFQMYVATRKPGDKIDVRSADYREFCEAHRVALV